jgi:putative CocE/NonD family hydrolase
MRRITRLSGCAAVLALLLPACRPADSPVVGWESQSAHYVTMRDGVRLAVDVNLPPGREVGDTHPALLELTRYGRSREEAETGKAIPSLGELDQFFLDHGYAVVKVDVRGSGASFSTRPIEYGPEEVRDGYDLVEWVVRQSWSDGTVGAYGTSYTGTTAELLAAVNHPAVKAVVPGWSDFETYESPVRPYGLIATSFISTWSQLVAQMDRNDVEALGSSIRRVDEDTDGSLLARALKEHEANPDVYEGVRSAQYRDDELAAGYTWLQMSPLWWRDDIERAGVPMLVPVSWLDAGTAEGALLRFRHYDNRQNVVVMATSHGGGGNASPYLVSDEPLPPNPSEEEQFEMRVAFFDHHLKGLDNGVDGWPPIRFWNLGEEAFHDGQSWPPPGTVTTSLYLNDRAMLTEDPPTGRDGADVYVVDPGVTTGTTNRWMTQMGGPVLGLDDRKAMDDRMLTYTSDRLEEDVQIAGTASVHIRMSSDRDDGIVLAYLEDVDPDGRSRYVTEGGLRLIHRKTSQNPFFADDLPYHSFARADARPMQSGQVETVSFQLQPIAVLIRRGHRIRLAIAGADADLFDPIPAEGSATLTVYRNAEALSVLELPVVPTGLRK